jgi:hypothetical protein
MRVIKEGPILKGFQKGLRGDSYFNAGGLSKGLKKAGEKITGKKSSSNNSKSSFYYTDNKGVKWSYYDDKGHWQNAAGKKLNKKAGIRAFNKSTKKSSNINLNTESTMAKTNEGLGDLAHVVEKDHEVQMARAQLYKIAKHAIQLHDMMQGMDPDTDLESWVQAKLTKSADYIDSVYHHLDAKNAAKAEEMDVLETAIKRARDTGSKADVYKATLEAKMNTKYLKQKGLTGDKAKDSKAYAKPRGKMPPPTIVMKNKKSDKHDARGKIKDID